MIRAALAALGSCLGAAPGVQEEPTFTCQLVLSADLDGVERWYGTNVPDFELAKTRRVVRGQHFLVYVFFQGCARDEGGALDVTLDLSILRPDGSEYHASEGAQALAGEGGGEILLTQELTGVFFEPEDALGTYRVELVAHDRNGTGSARAEAAIELVEYAEGQPFAGPDEVASWLWSYFHDPDPCRMAPALRAYAEQGVEDLRPAHGALAELLEGNAWLLPILFAELADGGPEVRSLLLWLLARTNHDPAPYVAELGADERELWERFRDTPNPIADPLAGPKDVNELLGRYLLGRGRARLHRLVRALSSEPSEVVADVTIHEPTRDVRVPLPRVMSRFVAGELAECAGDPSTRGYLEVWAEDEDLPPDVRARLAEILARADGEADGAGAPERDD